MAHEIDLDSQDRRSSSSSGRGATDSASLRTASIPAPVITEPPSAPGPRTDRTLEVRGAAARVIARALDSTMDAGLRDAPTPPTSSERLALLAAQLPSVPRDAYLVGKQVARGGIGRVMQARDERLDRPVAIKELLVWNEAQEQRFIREALLTAKLQHPAIVPIYEAGRWPDGEPFYAMKLVSGRSLAELIGERRTLAERMSLLPHVLTAAQAIAYAHSQHILHRDLKPANILVGEFGETVVIDWGLAKYFSEVENPRSGGVPVLSADTLTIDGAVIGTPSYMPPEQAAGDPVDERADIYAIGALLYHLIAAVPPYHDVPFERMLETIAREPPRPIEKHAPAISDEVCAIVHKAMARDPAARYRTAKELADDLHRFQTGQIVAAHTYSSAQLLGRFWRRNKAVLSMAASAFALLTLVIIAAFVKTDQERRFALVKQDEAEAAEKVAEAARTAAEAAGKEATERADEMTLLQAQTALGRDPNEALAWLKTLSPTFADVGEARRIAEDAQARGISRAFRGHTAHVNHVTIFDGGKRFITASDDKTVRVWEVATAESRVFSGHTDEAWNAAVLPDGKRFVSISKDGTVRLWDLASGETVAQVRMPGYTEQLVVAGDSTVLGASKTGSVPWAWTPGAPEVRVLSAPQERVHFSVFSEDGRRLVYQRQDGTAFALDVAGGARRALSAKPLKLGKWHLSADGKTAVHGPLRAEGQDQELEIWDTEARTSRTVMVAGAAPDPAISKRGDLVAVRGDELVEIYDTRTGSLVRRFQRPPSRIFKSMFSGDSRVLALGGYDKTVRTWDVTSGESRSFAGLNGFVSNVEFLPDERSILASSSSGDIRLFQTSRAGAILTDHGSKAEGFALSRDGRAASVDERGQLKINDLEGKRITAQDLGLDRPVRLAPSPDGQRFVGVTTHDWFKPAAKAGAKKAADGSLVFGTFDDKKPVIVALPAQPFGFAWHPNGRSVFLALDDRTVQRVDLDGTRTELERYSEPIFSVAVSPDGSLLAEGQKDGAVRLRELASGKSRELGKHATHVLSLAFSGDGRTLASGSFDHTTRLWRLADGTFRSFEAGGYGVVRLQFSPGDSTLYSLSDIEPMVRRWDVQRGDQLAPLSGHQGPIVNFALSADGRRVLTWSQDRTARIYDAATAKSRALVGHKDFVLGGSFAAADKLIVTLGREGAVRAWPDDLPEALPELRAWIEAATPDRIEQR